MLKNITVGVILVFCLGAMVTADAATIVASSCSQANVQSAINSAADGDIVSIPAGNCTWSSPVTADLSYGKGLVITGAACSLDSGGRPTSCPTTISGSGITVIGANGKPWRISNLAMRGAAGINVGGQSKTWRIDTIYFDTSTGYTAGRVIWVQPTGGASYTNGVIDHCKFYHPQTLQIHIRGSATDGGNNEWTRPLGLGGSDAIYVEDNEFIHEAWNASRTAIDGEGGARFVARNNIFTNTYIGPHDAIIGGYRSIRKFEIYNNTFNYIPSGSGCFVFDGRGGTGVFFNNEIMGTPGCGSYIQLDLKRTYQTGGDPWNGLCSNSSGKAYLGTSATYPMNCTSGTGCVNKDGSANSPTGYPCRDQIGVDGNDPQVSRPTLFWNNTLNGGNISIGVTSQAGSYIVNNRDYCIHATTMPATCNGITTNYSPFTYPHPLVTGSSPAPPTSSLIPPQGFRIIQ